MANKQQKAEIDKEEEKGKMIIYERLVLFFGKLPIIKTSNQMQIWQLKRIVPASLLVLLGVSQTGWQDTCK